MVTEAKTVFKINQEKRFQIYHYLTKKENIISQKKESLDNRLSEL